MPGSADGWGDGKAQHDPRDAVMASLKRTLPDGTEVEAIDMRVIAVEPNGDRVVRVWLRWGDEVRSAEVQFVEPSGAGTAAGLQTATGVTRP